MHSSPLATPAWRGSCSRRRTRRSERSRPRLTRVWSPRPTSPYGASKLSGEAYCSAFAGSYGVPTVVLRFSNVYGPYSYHKGSVVAAFCKRALAGEPLVVYGDGTQTRDFVFVEDLCRGIAAAVTDGGSGVVAHLASGTETTVLEVARLVAERLGGVSVEHRPARVGDVARSASDISTARAALRVRTPGHAGGGARPHRGLVPGVGRVTRRRTAAAWVGLLVLVAGQAQRHHQKAARRASAHDVRAAAVDEALAGARRRTGPMTGRSSRW